MRCRLSKSNDRDLYVTNWWRVSEPVGSISFFIQSSEWERRLKALVYQVSSATCFDLLSFYLTAEIPRRTLLLILSTVVNACYYERFSAFNFLVEPASSFVLLVEFMSALIRCQIISAQYLHGNRLQIFAPKRKQVSQNMARLCQLDELNFLRSKRL
jgi:hypothetical protein